MTRKAIDQVTTIDINTVKNMTHLSGLNEEWNIVLWHRLPRR
jgi:hypothetical protein